MPTEYLNNKIFEGIIAKFQQSKRDRAKYELILDDIKDTELRLSKRQQYQAPPQAWAVTRRTLEEVIHDFHNSENELTAAFYTLSENIVRYAKFSLIDAEDAVQEGVWICFEKIDRFDPEYRGKSGQKAKAFNYLTTCILNHLRQLYRSSRNYSELKRKYHDYLQSRFDSYLMKRYASPKNTANY